MLTILNYIDGQHVAAISGKTLEKIEPATGRVLAHVADSDGHDVEQAVQAAWRAFPSWSRTSLAERSRLLQAIAQRIETDLEPLALAESADTGKPLRLARLVDIPRAASNFR